MFLHQDTANIGRADEAKNEGPGPLSFMDYFAIFLDNGEEPAKIPIVGVRHKAMEHAMDVEVEDVFECPKPHYNQARQNILTFHQMVIQIEHFL